MQRPAGLNAKILVLLTVSVAAVMSALICIADSYQNRRVAAEIESSSEYLIASVMAGIQYPMSVGNNRVVHAQLRDIKKSMKDIELYVFDPSRRIVFSTEQGAVGRKLDEFIPSPAFLNSVERSLSEGRDMFEVHAEQRGGRRYLSDSHVILNSAGCVRCHGSDAKVIGAAVLRWDTTREYALIAAHRNTNVLISAFGLIAIVGGIYFLLRRLVISPIRSLVREVQLLPDRIAAGEPIGNTNVDRDDEIGSLQRAFHEMAWELDKITHAMERTNRELEFANTELESFAYSVSHDLRAPLRNIDGFSKILLDDFSEKLDDRAKHYLNRVRNGAMRMSHLIDDILVFSRIGRADMQFRIIPCGDIIRSVLDVFAQEIENRKIVVTVGELPSINCDSTLAQSLFSNLVSNAIKYSRRTDAPRVEIGYDRERHAVFVRDNGVGFEMKFHDKIFQVFQRLHLPEEYEGTGIGLAIVKRIAERHHWQVWAESAPDHGAVFFVKIPELREGTDAEQVH